MKHGANAAQTKAKAEREAAEEAAAQAQQQAARLLGVPQSIDHREAVLAEVGARYYATLWVREKVSELPSLSVQTQRGESAHLLLDLLNEREKRLNEILRLCHDMRIDQQKIDFARAFADQQRALIEGLIRDLGSDPDDDEVRAVVFRRLQLVRGASA